VGVEVAVSTSVSRLMLEFRDRVVPVRATPVPAVYVVSLSELSLKPAGMFRRLFQSMIEASD
jgi:hypothetical protein